MRELVFALEFRGKAAAIPGTEGRREARTTATSQTFSTQLEREGVRGHVDAQASETAVLEARVQRFGDGTFVEEGTIRYGAAGAVTFVTIGRGVVGPSAREGSVAGGVVWQITGGNGTFSGARGLITSNFTVTADGDVVDDHFARIFLP